jgi:hypothetical protein
MGREAYDDRRLRYRVGCAVWCSGHVHPWPWVSMRNASREEQGEERMYIGLGTIVLILLVVLVVRAL